MLDLDNHPEQIALAPIDRMLGAAGWVVQSKRQANLYARPGVAIKEYQTDIGPADYILFVDRQPVGVIEAKKESEGQYLTTVNDQAVAYGADQLKYQLNSKLLPFMYKSMGTLIRFTEYHDPQPRSSSIFHFHQSETLVVQSPVSESGLGADRVILEKHQDKP